MATNPHQPGGVRCADGFVRLRTGRGAVPGRPADPLSPTRSSGSTPTARCSRTGNPGFFDRQIPGRSEFPRRSGTRCSSTTYLYSYNFGPDERAAAAARADVRLRARGVRAERCGSDLRAGPVLGLLGHAAARADTAGGRRSFRSDNPFVPGRPRAPARLARPDPTAPSRSQKRVSETGPRTGTFDVRRIPGDPGCCPARSSTAGRTRRTRRLAPTTRRTARPATCSRSQHRGADLRTGRRRVHLRRVRSVRPWIDLDRVHGVHLDRCVQPRRRRPDDRRSVADRSAARVARG